MRKAGVEYTRLDAAWREGEARAEWVCILCSHSLTPPWKVFVMIEKRWHWLFGERLGAYGLARRFDAN